MKAAILGAMLASALAISAHAQTASPSGPATTAPGATTTTPPGQVAPGSTRAPSATTDPGARPAAESGTARAGANSFTESQAKARIAELGYTSVAGLAKDSDGIWRGTAMKGGKSHRVALDFRGNISVGQN